MSKIFLIVSAVLLLGAVGLNVLNRGKISAKLALLDSAKATAASAQSEAAKAKSNLKAAESKEKEATEKATTLENQMSSAIAERDEAKKKAAGVDEAIKAKDDEIIQLKRDAAIRGTASGATPAPVTDAEKGLAEATAQLAELKTVKDSLDNKVKTLESQVSVFAQDERRRAASALKPGLRGQVLAVDRNWNFVVLSLGNRNGVISNAQMIVQRGGSMVGKVRITSVEPSQSIADIVPNSVPPGVEVRPGDTVIFPGGS